MGQKLNFMDVKKKFDSIIEMLGKGNALIEFHNGIKVNAIITKIDSFKISDKPVLSEKRDLLDDQFYISYINSEVNVINFPSYCIKSMTCCEVEITEDEMKELCYK